MTFWASLTHTPRGRRKQERRIEIYRPFLRQQHTQHCTTQTFVTANDKLSLTGTPLRARAQFVRCLCVCFFSHLFVPFVLFAGFSTLGISTLDSDELDTFDWFQHSNQNIASIPSIRSSTYNWKAYEKLFL